MSTWQDAQKALTVAQIVVSGLEAMETVIGLGQPADAAIKAISAILTTVKAGASGAISSQDVLSSLQLLQDQLASDDAKADQAVHDKFDKG